MRPGIVAPCKECSRNKLLNYKSLCHACAEMLRREGIRRCDRCSIELIKNWNAGSKRFKTVLCKACAEIIKAQWSMLYTACRACGKTSRPHISKGYCRVCWQALARYGKCRLCNNCGSETLQNHSSGQQVLCEKCSVGRLQLIQQRFIEGATMWKVAQECRINAATVTACYSHFKGNDKTDFFRNKRLGSLLVPELKRLLVVTWQSAKNVDETQMLWLQAKAGDQEAWATLWCYCERSIVQQLLKKYYHPRNDRDEMSSACNLGFCQAVRDWNPAKSSFKTFCRLVVERRLIDLLNRERTKKRINFTCAVSLDAPLQDDDERTLHDLVAAKPEGLIDTFSRKRMVSHIVSSLEDLLSPMEKRLVEDIIQYPDETYEQRANRLCVSIKAIDNALQRIRNVKQQRFWDTYNR